MSIVNVRKIDVIGSAKIYRIARNSGKTMQTPGCNAVPVCTGDRDDVYMEDNNSMQHEEDSVVLTGARQKQDQEVEAQASIPCAKASTSYENR